MTKVAKKKVYAGGNVRISPQVLETVRKHTKENGYKMGWFFEQAVMEKIKKEKK